MALQANPPFSTSATLPHRMGDWPRLIFGGNFPGKVDLEESVPSWEHEAFEQRWRKVGVRVEWLRSPGGRVDQALADMESVADVMSGPEG